MGEGVIGVMKTIKIIIIIIISALILSFIRYRIELNNQRKQDIFNLLTKYEQMNILCETKYQFGIDNNMSEAYMTKGRQEQIQKEINDILNKY